MAKKSATGSGWLVPLALFDFYASGNVKFRRKWHLFWAKGFYGCSPRGFTSREKFDVEVPHHH
jgi:hypothetical protein